MTRPTVEFDDIIYTLQAFGGISEYWEQVTGRIEAAGEFGITRVTGKPLSRLSSPRSTANIFHSSYFRIPSTKHSKTVITVHDMAYEVGLMGNGFNVKLACRQRKRAYFAADALICISQRTKDELLSLFPALAHRTPIAVIHHGVSMAPVEHLEPMPGHLDSSPYVLFVGGRSHYKNFVGALQGFRASGLAKRGYSLVCTGKLLSDEESANIARLGLAGHVKSVGNVSRAELARLYARAHVLLYASLFEGFGMPMLEAMRLNCPVIASTKSCMPEIAGDAAVLVDTEDADAVAGGLLSLDDETFRSEIISRGAARVNQFSWERSAKEHMSLYRSLIA